MRAFDRGPTMTIHYSYVLAFFRTTLDHGVMLEVVHNTDEPSRWPF